MEKKLTKQPLFWVSAVAILLCIALLAGIIVMGVGDNGTPEIPNVAAGRVTTSGLGLELWKHNGTEYVNISDNTGDLFAEGDTGAAFEPGTMKVAFMQIKNTGAADITFNLSQEVQLVQSAAAPAGLSWAVIPGMAYENIDGKTWDAMKKASSDAGTLVIGSTMLMTDQKLAAGESCNVALVVYLDAVATSYQGITVDVRLSGKQVGADLEEQTVFYVSPKGHDGNPGTEAEPLKTFRRAAQQAKPGQTYIFEDGEYNEGGMTIISNSGTEDAPIVFKARNKGGAKIIYPESLCGTDKIQIFGKEYITIEGFDITQKEVATQEHPNAKMDVIIRCHTSNNITFRDNAIHGALEEPLKVYSANGILIEGNYIYDSGCEGIDFVNVSDSIIRDNEIAECGRMALMCKGGSRSVLFYNNIVRNDTKYGEYAVTIGGATDNKSTWGCTADHWEAFNCYAFNNVIIARDKGSWEYGLTIMGAKDSAMFNNVVIGVNNAMFFRNPDNSSLQWEWDPSNDNILMQNNIIMNTKKNVLIMNDVNNNVVFDYNLYYNNEGEEPEEAHGIYDQDPKFIAERSDWHLAEGSPAIGAGAAVADPKGYSGQTFQVGFDKDYILRGDTWDIGIFDADGTETYEPGGITFQDPEFKWDIDHTITEAPVIGTMPAQGTELLKEDFSQTTTLDKWIQCPDSDGKWLVKNEMLAMSETAIEGRALIGAAGGSAWTDYEFSAKVMAPSTKNGRASGIIFRADDKLENMYGFRFYPDSSADKVEFCMWNNLKFVSLQTINFRWETNKIYELKVIAVGEEFEFYIDGKKVATATDGSHASGTAGCYSYKESRIFDDLTVKSARGYQIVHLENTEKEPEYTGKILLDEKFTDPSVLADWKQYTGEWRIEGGILTGTTGIEGENIIIYDKGYNWVNYEFSADIRQPETGGMWAGLIFRCNDEKTGYYGFRFVNDNLQVVKGWPGNWSQIGIKAMAGLPKGEVATLKVVMEDDNFRLYLNDNKVWEDSDKMHKYGSIGLFQQNMTEIIFDNVLVKELVSDGTVVTPDPGDDPSDNPNVPDPPVFEGDVLYKTDFNGEDYIKAIDFMGSKWDIWTKQNYTNGFIIKDGKLTVDEAFKGNQSWLWYKGEDAQNWMYYDAEFQYTESDEGWAGLIFNATPGADPIALLRFRDGKIQLCEGFNTKKEVASGLSKGQTYNIRLEVRGYDAKVYVNNELKLSYTYSSEYRCCGGVGFIMESSTASFDNLAVLDRTPEDQPTDPTDPTDPEPTDPTDPEPTDPADPGSGDVLYSEDFSDALDSNWDTWTKQNYTNGFVVGNGVLTVTEDNKGNQSWLWYKGADAQNWVYHDVEFTLKASTSGWYGLMFNASSDGNNFMFLKFQGGRITVGGGLTGNLGEYTANLVDGQTYRIRVESRMNTATVYLDGEKIIEADISQLFKSGGVGFINEGGMPVIDDLKVIDRTPAEDPDPTDPTDPEPTDPEPTDPEPTDPEPTDPEPTDPEPTDPEPTNPEPTEPDTNNYLLNEDFSDALDSNWDIWTKQNYTNGFVVENGVLTINEAQKGNQSWLWYTGTDAQNWVYHDVEFTLKASSTGMYGLMFNCDAAANNFLFLKFQGGKIIIGGGLSGNLGEYTANLEDGQTYKIRVEARVNTATVYLDDVKIIEADISQYYKSGGVGFINEGGMPVIDDLKVIDRTPAEEPEPTEPTDPEPTEPEVIEGEVVVREPFDENTDMSKWGMSFEDGTYVVVDGKLVYVPGASTIYYKDGSWTDVVATFKLTLLATETNNGWLKVYLRTTDGTDGAYLYFQNLETDSVKIMVGDSVIAEVTGVSVTALFDGSEHDFKVEIHGNTLKLTIDGNLINLADDSRIEAVPGSVGFSHGNMEFAIDDLTVYCQDPEKEPEPTEPEPTEPEPTEPEPTEPEPTEPEPAEPDTNTYLMNEDFADALDSNWDTWTKQNYTNGFVVGNGVLTVTEDNKGNQSWLWYKGADAQNWVYHDVEFTLKASTSGWYGLMFNASSDGNNFMFLKFQGGKITVGGGLTGNLGEYTANLVDGQTYRIRVESRMNTATVYLDGEKIIEADISQLFKSGGVGFINEGGMPVIDDLKVIDRTPAEDPDPTDPTDPEPTEPEKVVLYENDFNVANGADLKSTMGTGWDVWVSGNKASAYTIQNDALAIADANKGNQTWLWDTAGTNWTNYDMTYKFTASSAGWCGTMIHSDAGGNSFLFLKIQGSNIFLGNGFTAKSDTVDAGFEDGKTYSIQISVRGSAVTVYVDGVEKLAYTFSSELRKYGAIGFITEGSLAVIDDLKVVENTDDPAPSPPAEPPKPEEVVLLNEDFSDTLDSNWDWWASGGSNGFTVADGALSIIEANKGTQSWVWYKNADAKNWTNYDLTCKVTANTAGWSGIMFNSDTGGSKFMFLKFSGSSIALCSGTSNTIKSYDAGLVDGQIYEIRIEARVSQVKVYLDGTEILAADISSYFKSGGAGFISQGSLPVFDDLKIVDRTPAEAAATQSATRAVALAMPPKSRFECIMY